MTSRAAASRYARALFDVLQQQANDASLIERAQTDLQGLADLVGRFPQLAATFGNPAIPAARKRGVVQALLDKAAITGPVARLVLLLADRDRLMLLPDVATTYRERVLDWKHVIRGEVTTAVPIASGTLRALEQRLTQATGRTVTLDAKVDPAIVGGAVTRLGSLVYDGSVTTQLEKLKETLIATGQQ
jgi:F-type H+-transporting ATPase subunit delta